MLSVLIWSLSSPLGSAGGSEALARPWRLSLSGWLSECTILMGTIFTVVLSITRLILQTEEPGTERHGAPGQLVLLGPACRHPALEATLRAAGIPGSRGPGTKRAHRSPVIWTEPLSTHFPLKKVSWYKKLEGTWNPHRKETENGN